QSRLASYLLGKDSDRVKFSLPPHRDFAGEILGLRQCRQGLDPQFVAPPLPDGELFECLVDGGSLHERRDSYQQFACRRVATLEEVLGQPFELGILIAITPDGAFDTPFST